MSIFKREQKKSDLNLVLDIGTEFVKALLFKVEDEVTYIKASAKVRQSPASMKSGVVNNIKNVIKTCDEAINQLNIERSLINQTFIGMAGELVKGIPVEIEYTRQNVQKEISQEEIHNIINKIEQQTYEEANKMFYMNSEHSGEHSIELIDTSIVDCIIDGFRVDEPIGLTGEQVILKIYFTFAPVLHIGYLNTIAKQLNLNLNSIVAEPFAIAYSIHGRKENDFSAVIIDIGGGTSDVAIVKNGVLAGTQMLAFGGRVFTKRISMTLNVPIDEAEDLKIKYSDRSISVNKIPEIKKAINPDIHVWVKGMEILMRKFTEDVKSYPNQILICGGGSLLPEIKDALIEYPWTKVLPFNRAPKVSFLMPQDLRLIKDETGNLSGADDITPLSIAKFGADKINK